MADERAVDQLRDLRVAALCSPAPVPEADWAEEAVALRYAIAHTRNQAGECRDLGMADIAIRYNRRADVLEHVLRRVLREEAGSDGQ
jgi:hypothetical protein